MPATTTGGPFDLNVPSSTNDFADLYGTYLVPNMETINDNAAHKGVAQTFTAAQTFSTTLTVTAGGANIGGDVVVSSGSVTGVTLKAAGLTGATQVSRYVGATTSGAPSTGTFSVGDYVIDQSGAIHVCTTGGSPGTWTAIGNVTYGTPGSSAVGDSAAAGSATTSARSDHRHGREAFGSPTSLTFGGSSTDGTSSSPARADHVHGLGAAVTSVTAGNGISISGTTTPTITASIAAGTGISISGTTTLSVSATGVQSLTAGTGISVSGTTTPTVTNSGVTSIVAGTNVTVSGATGAVTVNAPGFATPGSSAIGDAAAAGTATTVSRSDHVHGREAAGTPGASAVGDTAAAGVATTVARSDHRHSREAFGTPVNLDASLTSLSAGSLTTVARADHVHTVSNATVRIASTSVTNTTTTSVNFSSIPQTYTSLWLFVAGYVTNGPDSVSGCDLQFNGDTGANYANPSWVSSLTTAAQAAFLHGPANFYPTKVASTFIVIHNYRTSFDKVVCGTTAYNNSTTAVDIASGSLSSIWKSSSAITSITIKTRGAYFNNGAVFSLCGIP